MMYRNIVLLLLVCFVWAGCTDSVADIQKLVDNKKYNEAIAKLNKAIARKKLNKLLELRYECYMDVGNYAAAEKDIEELEKHPDNRLALYAKHGLVRYKLGHIDSAISDLQTARIMNHSAKMVNGYLAVIYAHLKEYRTAMQFINDEIEMYPNDCHPRLIKSTILISLNEYQRALNELDTAERLEPGSDEVYARRGYCYYKMENQPEAIKNYSKAISIDSGDGDYYEVRACAYSLLDSTDKAIADLNNCIKIRPDSIRPHILLALCYNTLRSPEKVCAELSVAKKINPDYVLPDVLKRHECK